MLKGKIIFFSNQVFKTIVEKYNKSSAKIIVRWFIEQNIVALAKSVNIDRMTERLMCLASRKLEVELFKFLCNIISVKLGYYRIYKDSRS